ncbi:hypothetical protein ASD81_20305 [Nocardioides sp. Root614]|nr:hypothetical protein ASD81_20305 [Nocardioides sp. Root614]KRA86954.1 hypothetical protein ASD84_22520 [Nocardioides sp. Root682]
MSLRQYSPAWRLLGADNAPLIIGFLESAFLSGNVRRLPAHQIRDLLDDHLEAVRAISLEGAYPKTADAYLADWSDARAGWLRRYYPAGTDVAHYEPTSPVETVAAFVRGLGPREFLGTASRILTVRDLLRQIAGGAGVDPDVRLAALKRQRDELDEQIAAVRAGEDVGLDETAVRERYQQALATARELLGDLRQVEENFRALDRDVRLRATTWNGPRGEFLESVFGTTTEIGDSDQGRSWAAFWAHLLAPKDQAELDELLTVLADIPALSGDSGAIGTVLKTDLFVAAEAAQRTVASLSSQLRRFLDEQTWAEGRLIHASIRNTLTLALAARDQLLKAPGADITSLRADISLPLERPLYTPRAAAELHTVVELPSDTEELDDLEDLLEVTSVDLDHLRNRIHEVVARRAGNATLRQVVDTHPIADGLAELVGYLRIAETEPGTYIDPGHTEQVSWDTDPGATRRATVPLVVFGEADDAEEDEPVTTVRPGGGDS